MLNEVVLNQVLLKKRKRASLRAVDTSIWNLRRKLGKSQVGPIFFQTVRVKAIASRLLGGRSAPPARNLTKAERRKNGFRYSRADCRLRL